MWDRFFDLDNVVWRTIDKIGKIFLLNLLWLICSLPVFTIGASTTALIYTSMKLSDNEGYWHQNFFSSFKENFKQATALFFIYLAAGAFLAGDFLLGGRAGQFLRAADAGSGGNSVCTVIFLSAPLCVRRAGKVCESGQGDDPVFLFCRNAQHEDDDPACNLDDSVCLGEHNHAACQFPDADLWNRSDGIFLWNVL